MKHYPKDWWIEDTGGGCQWLRRGSLAITNGEAELPKFGQPCQLVPLNKDGCADTSLVPIMDFPSLESALAYVNAHAYRQTKVS